MQFLLFLYFFCLPSHDFSFHLILHIDPALFTFSQMFSSFFKNHRDKIRQNRKCLCQHRLWKQKMCAVSVCHDLQFTFSSMTFHSFFHSLYVSAGIPETIVLRSRKDQCPFYVFHLDRFLLRKRMQFFRSFEHLTAGYGISALFRFFPQLLPVLWMSVCIRKIRNRFPVKSNRGLTISRSFFCPVFFIPVYPSMTKSHGDIANVNVISG